MVQIKEYVVPALIILLIILSFFILKPFLLAICIGGLLAYLFFPLQKRLFPNMKNRTLVSLLLCILVLLIVLIPSIFLIKRTVHESYSLYTETKHLIAQGVFQNCHNTFCLNVKEYAQDPIVSEQVQNAVTAGTRVLAQRGSDFLASIPFILINLFIIFFTMFYFLKDGPSFINHINDLTGLPEQKFKTILFRLRKVARGLAYGYILIALLQGFLGGLGFWIFGVQSPLFWGLVMAILALIPFLGTGVVWFPASLYLTLQGAFQDSSSTMAKGIGLFFYGLILVSGIDNVLKPKIMGGAANIHPAIIMLGIFGGIFLLGPFGAIVGPFVLALTVILLEELVLQKNCAHN